jgi:general secretion pathway protein J
VDDIEVFSLAVKEEFWLDWQQDWQESATSPALVRLQLKSAGRFWPDLVMQVQR